MQYSGLSVSISVGATLLSNWDLISVEGIDWMSVWAAWIYSTAVSSLSIIQQNILEVSSPQDF